MTKNSAQDKMKKIAVILCGCGSNDGSEIHEATLSLWALAKYDFQYQCFAPNKPQHHVINHYNSDVSNESRNMLVEAARIARGNIKELSLLKVEDFDAIVFPGGFGAAKNLCNYAFEGRYFSVDPEIEKIINAFHSEKKPIVALCITPVIIAKVLKAKVTIGDNRLTTKIIEGFGAEHENKNYDEICFDEKNLIITTPCYMLAENPYQISLGIEKSIVKLKSLLEK